jgi:glycosidase
MRLLALLAALLATPAVAQDYRQRLPEDEVIYFVLPDRFANGDRANDTGGIKGGPLQTGFDPTRKGFYQGGDLKGLTARLPYIKAMGVTAIWVGPIFKNKAVQGGPGQESAGYHGYWVTDFTQVDPHLGTNADFKALVDAAHAAGMKVYMDIITNHTADVIQYRECVSRVCAYRPIADYPYQRARGVGGKPINPGFQGDAVLTAENFAKLTDPNYAYEVFVPPAERNVKVPAWLNDPTLYHNRGNSTWVGESVIYGDFVGLDDLYVENPRVVTGMIDIFGDWIDRYGVDGFRIDTAKHVNPEFWQAFVPAMLARAKAKGIPNFHIFGEVMSEDLDPGYLASFTRVDRYPAVLDFAFRTALIRSVAGTGGTDVFAKLFAGDPLYEGGAAAAQGLPTFTGNHDLGRFAHFVRKSFPQASEAEVLARVQLAHAMVLLLRGVPTIYSGDEQGFAGDGGDQDARETLFASMVATYTDNRLVGTARTHAVDNYATDHPLYRHIAQLAKLRAATPALRRGRQLLRYAGDKPGLLAISRFDPDTGKEVLIAFNTGVQPITAQVQVEPRSLAFDGLLGACAAQASAPGSVTVTLPAFGAIACAAR